jgi:hypothetical protein
VGIAGKTPLAMTSMSEGAHVAGEVYGPVLSPSEVNFSTFFSAHATAPSTTTFTPWANSSTTLAAEWVPSFRFPKGVEGFAGVADFVGVEGLGDVGLRYGAVSLWSLSFVY